MTLEILHLDDDIQTLDRFKKVLNSHPRFSHANLWQFETSTSLFEHINSQPKADVVLLDIRLSPEDLTGLEVAQQVRKRYPQAAILMCSASRDLSLVRDSLTMGADDFLTKDWSEADITKRIEMVLNFRKLRTDAGLHQIEIAGSTMKSIAARIPQIIQSAVNCVYVEGESGTGKEVVAALVEAKARPGSPFIKVNCATIPPSLAQSELFGHLKGAFTGATADKKGLLEAANGGWIFLDEIASLPAEAQAGLLRAIECQTIRQVGSTTETKITFRIISASNEPLSKLVQLGTFRKDLWQRLCETQINLPPLRNRKDEIPDLAKHLCTNMRGGPYTLAPLVLEALQSHDWSSGNVRELRNCLRAMTETAAEGLITLSSLPDSIWSSIGSKDGKKETPAREDHFLEVRWDTAQRPSFEQLSLALLIELLRLEFRKTGPMSMRSAAKAAAIPKSTMAKKLEKILSQNLLSQKELQLLISQSRQTDGHDS
jgi:DNA-binding NtrC family response regulator